MDFQAVIDKYYPEDDALRRLLIRHSRQVAGKCRTIIEAHPDLDVDPVFVEEAAMLHDIGIRWCHAPSIFCHGDEPYIQHGVIGGKVLRAEGFPRHARVSERHTGTGLPGLEPETQEEVLVCYADKFFSKSRPDQELTVEQVAQSLGKFGQEGVDKFLTWAKLFE